MQENKIKGNSFLRIFYLATILGMLWNSCSPPLKSGTSQTKKYVMIIHGGAGIITKENMSQEKEKAYKDALARALEKGYSLLSAGEPAEDAVVATINTLEDSPLFNAGKGAVFAHNGRNELDASIMAGKTLEAGAVAGVTNIKNPINAARAVMDHSRHVLLTGKGAETFAANKGCETVPPSYFHTENRWKSLQRAINRDSRNDMNFNHSNPVNYEESTEVEENHKFGTVGCVALDQEGNLVAGTSTGGLTNKQFGRVGDSPIIGAGTYCNNATAGISCTGTGEYFMRTMAAYRVSALMELQNLSLREAGQKVIDEIGAMGGDGGLIGLDHQGNITAVFNTPGMYRGTVEENGRITIGIFQD